MDKNLKKPRMIQEDMLQIYRLENTERGQIHFPYELEDKFCSAVSEGKREEAHRLIQESFQFSLGVISYSEEKQYEYQAVIIISMIARAAIQGGMDAYRSYDMSDLYLQRVSQTSGEENFWAIIYDALDAFISEVQEIHAIHVHSVHVLRAKQYIGTHLNSALSLKEVSAAVGVSPTYLSTIFKGIEPMGFKEYVIRQRIEAAKSLLTYSDCDIGTIAIRTGFCSQSHFGKMFRLHTGMTPLKYRKLYSRTIKFSYHDAMIKVFGHNNASPSKI